MIPIWRMTTDFLSVKIRSTRKIGVLKIHNELEHE